MMNVRNLPKVKKPRPAILHDWEISPSAFDPQVLMLSGTEADGTKRLAVMTWCSEGIIGTDTGRFRLGMDGARSDPHWRSDDD